jgi:hypothetical protein
MLNRYLKEDLVSGPALIRTPKNVRFLAKESGFDLQTAAHPCQLQRQFQKIRQKLLNHSTAGLLHQVTEIFE